MYIRARIKKLRFSYNFYAQYEVSSKISPVSRGIKKEKSHIKKMFPSLIIKFHLFRSALITKLLLYNLYAQYKVSSKIC